MSSKKRRQVVHLTAYLQQAGSMILPRQKRAAVGAFAVFLGFPWLVGGFIGIVGSPLEGLVSGLVSIPLAIAAAVFMLYRASKPINDDERRQRNEAAAIERFRRLANEKELHKKLDPEALAILESAAMHRMEVKALAAAPAGGAHASLRIQSDQAAEAGMRELLVLLQGCIGERARQPKDDLEDIWDDFTDGDIREAISGLQGFLAAKPESYAPRSPEMSVLRQPALEIAERMRSLAGQLRKMLARPEPSLLQEAPASAAGIDRLLQDMRDLEQAEDELRLNG
jgi:hypothetical protein